MPVILFLLPESVWWLSLHGKDEKAKKTLNRLYGRVSGYDVDREYEVIRFAITQEQTIHSAQKSASWFAIFRGVDAVSV